MFENLSDRLGGVFDRLTKQGALTEDDVTAAMREVRVALLDARGAEVGHALVDVDGVDEWWLCGPLGMTEDAVAVLSSLDVARGRVHRELFYVDEPPPELQQQQLEQPLAAASVCVCVCGGVDGI